MSCVFMTSDWHLAHKRAYTWSGSFSSQEEREKHILDMYRMTVSKRDIVWFLGDIAFDLSSLAYVDGLPGDKRLILGNHCTDKFSKQVQLKDLQRVFSQIHGMHQYKHSWLTHAPVHPCELRGKLNIHGHTHQHSVPKDPAIPTGREHPAVTEHDDRYVNVCLENTGFKLIKYQDILDGWRENETSK